MKKRIFSMLLVFAMVFSMLPTYTFAADISYGQGEADKAVEETGVTALKTVTDNGDGTYTITLSVQGYTNETSEQRDLPADIVLVVDTSTSMDYAVTEKECDGTPSKVAIELYVTLATEVLLAGTGQPEWEIPVNLQ